MKTVDRKGFFGAVGSALAAIGVLPLLPVRGEARDASGGAEGRAWGSTRDGALGVPDYATARDGALRGYRITVSGEDVDNVFEFSIRDNWVRAYAKGPCVVCGYEGEGKHLRFWGGTRYQGWERGPGGRDFPTQPDPVGCWYELMGPVRLFNPRGRDVTDAYLRGLVGKPGWIDPRTRETLAG